MRKTGSIGLSSRMRSPQYTSLRSAISQCFARREAHWSSPSGMISFHPFSGSQTMSGLVILRPLCRRQRSRSSFSRGLRESRATSRARLRRISRSRPVAAVSSPGRAAMIGMNRA
jgi:hypothetical protein